VVSHNLISPEKYQIRKVKDMNSWLTCISGSIPVLNAKTRLAAAPIVVKILLVVVPGML
jgi:hypothetical protein